MDAASKLGLIATDAAERETPELLRKREAERYAALLSGLGAAGARSAVLLAPSDESHAPPSVWRTHDGSLTPTGTTSGASTPAADPEISRVCLEVEAGDLGSVRLEVDRGKTGVNIVIGVTDERAQRALEPERMQLERALEASGIQLRALTVVQLGRGGTVLAPAQKRERGPNASRSDELDENKKKQSRRAKWIG